MANTTIETIGCDLGDKTSEICVLAGDGSKVRATVRTTRKGMTEFFTRAAAHVVIEVGVSTSCGHDPRNHCLTAGGLHMEVLSRPLFRPAPVAPGMSDNTSVTLAVISVRIMPESAADAGFQTIQFVNADDFLGVLRRTA